MAQHSTYKHYHSTMCEHTLGPGPDLTREPAQLLLCHVLRTSRRPCQLDVKLLTGLPLPAAARDPHLDGVWRIRFSRVGHHVLVLRRSRFLQAEALLEIFFDRAELRRV